MTYSVKEIFKTLQGEGAQAGLAAVFCRFAGCNLWSGREEDRATAVCQFCDTDFVGTEDGEGGKFATAESLASAIEQRWGRQTAQRFVVFTGGEPLLQLDEALVDAVHALGFEIAIETNGTLAAPAGIDWICVSPKAGAPWNLRVGNELKLVYPQARRRGRRGLPPLLAAADGRSDAHREYRACGAILPRAPAMAAERADA